MHGATHRKNLVPALPYPRQFHHLDAVTHFDTGLGKASVACRVALVDGYPGASPCVLADNVDELVGKAVRLLGSAWPCEKVT